MIFEKSAPLIQHLPVMVDEILTLLEPERGGWIVDGTLGLGGHTEAFLKQSETVRVLAIDRDTEALALARQRLAPFVDRVLFVHGDFRDLRHILTQHHLTQVFAILVDLGVSSWQLGQAHRGFSFQLNGPLDMRMDQTKSVTAAELVNTLSAEELANVIFEYGEEPASRRIARRIVNERVKHPIETTEQLAELVRRAVPFSPKQFRIDPATRTFQALRIAVNRELEHLDQFVADAIDHLLPDGKLAVITFHSLEDRLIKRAFRVEAGLENPVTDRRTLWLTPHHERTVPPKRVSLVTKKPVVASETEIDRNPRARSAKLRVCQRVSSSDSEALFSPPLPA